MAERPTPVPAPLTEADEQFLARPRLGIFTTAQGRGGLPAPVPVWFEWADGVVRLFAGAGSPKTRRLAADPRASMLVVNDVGEGEHWVAFEGTVTSSPEGVVPLVERLAARYWDLSQPAHAATLESWRAQPAAFVVLTLTPERVRRYAG
jgi:hypothetical protein